MPEMIALVFEGIESLIFNLPAYSTALHKFIGIVICYSKISNPTEMLRFFGRDFPVFQEVNQQILIWFIQRDLVKEKETMRFLGIIVVDQIKLNGFVILSCFFHFFEQERMIALFDTQNVMKIVFFRLPYMWCVRT